MSKGDKDPRQSKDQRRAQIIDSALKVFIEKGYKGATTAGIAKEAGISEVTLFRYFSSKKELFMSGLEPIFITTMEHSIILAKDMPALAKLKYILKDRIEFVSLHNQVIKLILMESQINTDVVVFDYINKIVALLQESIKESGLSLKNEDASLRLLMGSILSFLYLPEKNEEIIDEYVNMLVSIIDKHIVGQEGKAN